jgi:hypothetical protein
MCYGIDSGSKRTLAFIRKNIPHDILYDRVVETANQGIIPTLSFVIGFPEEEKQDIDETLVLALRAGMVGNNNPLIQMPTVLPGTELHSRYAHSLVRQVDTYFALGLEFDGGRRLKSDDHLIDSDPLIFSSFYNLPCPGRSLEDLNLIASYFPLMVRFYPKTFMLLSLECKESVSDLFLRWLVWLKVRMGKKDLGLSPPECYRHFREFAAEALGHGKEIIRAHLPQLLKYETLALEVGKHPIEESPFHIDLDRVREFRPVKSRKTMVEPFDFHIPEIISDLKAGRFQEAYPSQKTLLAFQQQGDLLQVTEINDFAWDFLELCDGRSTLETISEQLYDRYGKDTQPADFFDSCVEAVQVLCDQHLLESESTPTSPSMIEGER